MASTPVSLNSFYVYNPLFGPDEDNQEDKILFYHPDEEKLGNKVKNVGLCEALVNFSRTFSPNRLCESLHTVKRKQAFFQPESNYFMILTVNNPTVMKKTKDGKMIPKYKEDDVDDVLLQSVLKQCYTIFRLFHGSFNQITSSHGVDYLRRILNDFFNKYLTTLNFDEMDVLTSIDGIQFLPVEKQIYLKIMCFINLTNNTFPQIRETIFMYKDHLVWSGLEQDDIRVLYKFIVNFLNTPSSIDIIPINRSTQSGFLTGPNSLEGRSVPHIPKIYIGDNCEPVYLIIYKRADITCIFLFDEPMPVDIDMYRALSQFVGPQLENLSPAITENYSRKQSIEDTYRFIYFNHMNLALKSPIRHKMGTLSKEIIQTLNQMHADFKRSKDSTNEQIINTGANRWVVGKRSENRELYIIFDDKKTVQNLVQVNDELRKLYGSLFGSIFLN